MIVQGMQDPNVTPENVRVVVAGLQHAGVEYQTLTFDDEGHGIRKPQNLHRLLTTLAGFFAEAFSPHGEGDRPSAEETGATK
jgi:dipeptidyl aminopeptidase/acylaminoacyl peptidase